MIDPIWNKSVKNDELFKDVLVDIYAPTSVNLTQIDDYQGMQVLARALKGAAINLSPEESRQYYLEENEDYGTDVVRISDVESLDCWYGYIYTQNKSPHRLQEVVRPQLVGLEVVWPRLEPDQDDIDIDVPSGSDNIIILRRTQPSCQYGLQYMTHPRELNDDEMLEIAKLMEEVNYFGESQAFYKLYNTARGAVFYFENQEPNKKLACTFEMDMQNLYIVGEPQNATLFEFELDPGQSASKMLKPIEDGEATGIQMRYEFKLDEV